MRGPTQAQRGSLRVLKALSMQHHKETQIHKGRMVTKARETSTFRVMWVPAPACPSHPSVTAHYVHLVPPGWAYRYRCFSYILSLASSCSHGQFHCWTPFQEAAWYPPGPYAQKLPLKLQWAATRSAGLLPPSGSQDSALPTKWEISRFKWW